MSNTTRGRRSGSKKLVFVQKPTGRLTPRVQAVGPDHFGIISIDPAKSRSCYLLCNFYGNVLIEPTYVNHTRGDLQAAIDRLRQTLRQHDLRDYIVAIERTGQYHRPVQSAFKDAGFDTRLVHPYATKQFRQPADSGNKTEPTDLAAIFRVALNGFGLSEPSWPTEYLQLQLLRRHRHDLVKKRAVLQCQIREHLHAAMPGYAELFCHLWESPAAMVIARATGSPAAVRLAGLRGLQDIVNAAGIAYQMKTLLKVWAWAENAPPSSPHSACLGGIIRTLDDDHRQKTKEIQRLEQAMAAIVVNTPYILLLAIPGINIVSAADLAGEAGPIDLYANANAVAGRAALMPSRYQSDQVDCANGPLRRMGNRRLRAVLLLIADNLVRHNKYFAARAALWQRQGKDKRWIRVKVGKSFSRIAYVMVAGRQLLLTHPCCRDRHYILDKILKLYTEEHFPSAQLQADLNAAAAQLPSHVRAEEAKPLQSRLDEAAKRKRGPQPLADILPLVLAKLGLNQVQSDTEGNADPS
jgi:transposase